MVHALLWEHKADLHSSKLHEWAAHWKSKQSPEVLEYMATNASKRLSEQVCALDVFFIAFVKGSLQGKLVNSVDKRKRFGR